MSHYEERLERDLETIRSRVREVAVRVQEALRDSVHALLSDDSDLANSVILGDLPINREIRAIDARCHAFVARHLPSAGHLRFVSSVLRLGIEIERIGDYAVAIAREVIQLSAPPPAQMLKAIDLIADQSRQVFAQAMRAHNERNAEMARGTMEMAKQVDRTFQRVFSDLLAAGEAGERPLKDLFALLVVINHLDRVADQAKNICEETVFALTGETKGEKVYRILFLDERNSGFSQMAEAFGRKAFPESARFSSAGWNPAAGIDPQVEVFLERNGLDVAGLQPQSMQTIAHDLDSFHVIVGLASGAREQIPEVPFHTVLLEWDLGTLPEGLDAERLTPLLDEAFKQISVRLSDLMETLRGETAA